MKKIISNIQRKEEEEIDNEDIKNITNFSDPNNIRLDNQIPNTYGNSWLVNAFTLYKSKYKTYFIIYAEEDYNIICYNISEKKIITQIKNAHNTFILGFRHLYDSYKNKDYIMSLGWEVIKLKVWDTDNWGCILELNDIYKNGSLFSACFLHINNTNYIIASNGNKYGDCENLKVFDFKGNKIKEINDSKNDTVLVEVYFDKPKSTHFILTGNNRNVKSYDYEKNCLYHNYQVKDNEYVHDNMIINSKNQLIESCRDGIIRIWNFHLGNLLKEINVGIELRRICLWNENYIFAACCNKTIRLIEVKSGKVINTLSGHNYIVSTVKKIFVPNYGELLVSQNHWEGDIKIWINKP